MIYVSLVKVGYCADEFCLKFFQGVIKAVVATVNLRAGRYGVIEASTEPILILTFVGNLGIIVNTHHFYISWCYMFDIFFK